jgi:2-C-methyl-D-erythritol 2,4-cyclodiphosphate synthase
MGLRFGSQSGLPKTLYPLLGEPVLVRTVKAFLYPFVSSVCVAVPEAARDVFEGYLKPLSSKLIVVPGGSHREESVRLALSALPPYVNLVLVHDGARPFAGPDLILEVIRGAVKYGAAIAAVKAGDTLKKVSIGEAKEDGEANENKAGDNKENKDGKSQGSLFVSEEIDREDVWRAQTPQGFKRDILSQAMESPLRHSSTDEAGLVQKVLGIKAFIVRGSEENIKITLKDDLPLAEAIALRRDGALGSGRTHADSCKAVKRRGDFPQGLGREPSEDGEAAKALREETQSQENKPYSEVNKAQKRRKKFPKDPSSDPNKPYSDLYGSVKSYRDVFKGASVPPEGPGGPPEGEEGPEGRSEAPSEGRSDSYSDFYSAPYSNVSPEEADAASSREDVLDKETREPFGKSFGDAYGELRNNRETPKDFSDEVLDAIGSIEVLNTGRPPSIVLDGTTVPSGITFARTYFIFKREIPKFLSGENSEKEGNVLEGDTPGLLGMTCEEGYKALKKKKRDLEKGAAVLYRTTYEDVYNAVKDHEELSKYLKRNPEADAEADAGADPEANSEANSETYEDFPYPPYLTGQCGKIGAASLLDGSLATTGRTEGGLSRLKEGKRGFSGLFDSSEAPGEAPGLFKDLRVGKGSDFHAFGKKDEEGVPLILGCVSVPFEKRLIGHSDADVLTHALIDALLGAGGAGDIGTLFPDKDSAYKGASGEFLLKSAWERLKDDFLFISADLTLIGEEPKIAPYSGKIRERLSLILGVKPGTINVKGKTTERMGFLGRGEGLGAEAVALLLKKSS